MLETFRSVAPIGFLLALVGCTGLPSYGVHDSSPHKDVVHLMVFLEERSGPEVYRTIALREFKRFQSDRRQRGGTPLYRVSVEFHKKGPEWERIALVQVHFSAQQRSPTFPRTEIANAEPPTIEPRIETILY